LFAFARDNQDVCAVVMEGSSKTTLPATTVPVVTRISQCYSGPGRQGL
jgi:hypothetical protein